MVRGYSSSITHQIISLKYSLHVTSHWYYYESITLWRTSLYGGPCVESLAPLILNIRHLLLKFHKPSYRLALQSLCKKMTDNLLDMIIILKFCTFHQFIQWDGLMILEETGVKASLDIGQYALVNNVTVSCGSMSFPVKCYLPVQT